MAKLLSIIPILIILISSFLLAFYLRIELPNTTENLLIPTLESHVKITLDEFGIYHIDADSSEAGLKAQGYLMARERLWQMDFYRRQAQGTLSEIFYQFEPSIIDIDYSLRALGLYRIALRDWDSFSSETKNFYEDFSLGVNLFIENNKYKLPIEFGFLNYSPDPWTPIDTISILKLMAFSQNSHAGGESIIGIGIGFINESVLLDLVRLALDDNTITWKDPVAYPVVEPNKNTNSISTTISNNSTIVINSTETTAINSTLTNTTNPIISKFENSFLMEYLSSEFTFKGGSGSNNWVVSGSKTTTGKPMLANDPHMELETPSRWWFVDLKTPDFHVTGMTLPGIPGIVLGRNNNLVWGFTNSMIDSIDTYVETFNENYTSYFYNNSWWPTTILHERFNLSNGNFIYKDIYITEGNDSFNHGHRPVVPLYGINSSIRWTGQDSTSAAEALIKLIKSTTKEEFQNGLQSFNAPSMNIVYADNLGNIGLYVSGDIPIRKNGFGIAPHSGDNQTYEWSSFVPKNESFQIINPSSGFIVTANDHFIPNSYPYHLGYSFDSNYRALRIRSLLSSTAVISYDSMKSIQNDVYSLFAKAIVPKILIPVSDPEILAIEQTLNNWDYEYNTESTQGPLLALFTDYFLENVLSDDLKNKYDDKTNFLVEIPLKGKLTENLLNLPQNSNWFNDSNSATNETKNDMIYSAFESVKNYYKDNNLDINTFTWGDLHKVKFNHILGGISDLFNAGGLQPSPGDKYTVNVGTYNENFIQSDGPSMRQIMGLDINRTHLIIVPPGQSGLFGQIHYADQISRWLNGNYCTIVILQD